MLDQAFLMFESIENFFWTYVGVSLLLSLGLYLSWKSRWFQIRQLPEVFFLFKNFCLESIHDKERGVSPIYAFFASIGGSIGINNVISICTAVKIGGPGAVFWVWVAAVIGMLVKYGEIYLGVKFRIKDTDDSYFGGPMVYLRKVPGGSWLAYLVSILLCLYGVEIYMFRVITQSVSVGLHINPNIVIAVLLVLVLGVGQGGVKLVGKMSFIVIPLFLLVFWGMSVWVFIINASKIPSMLSSIFVHAFTPHAAIGAFTGSSVALSLSYGLRRACYIADIGTGYASTIHAETSEAISSRQASMGIIDIVLVIFFVCTFSMFNILLTGVWCQDIPEEFMVVEAFAQYVPYIHTIWPLFIFLLGYSSLLALFTTGHRSAMLLSPKYGSTAFVVFAGFAFLTFSYIGTSAQCMSIMAIVGLLLLVINLYGLFYLKDEVVFDLKLKE